MKTVPDEKVKGVIEIESEPAAGSQPAHVSVFIDGDRRFTVRTSDLENIGAQLRGKKSFSVFYSIGLPILISLLTVVGTTLVGQFFQYVSWRNSTLLAQTTERVSLAKATYEKASEAISARYYASKLYLDAALELNRNHEVEAKPFKAIDLDLNKKHFNSFHEQMKTWSNSYDQLLSDIDFNMDRPLLWHSERVSVRNFDKLKCDQMLTSELKRLNLNVYSLKVQFAAINYCFTQSLVPFDIETKRVVASKDYIIPKTEKAAAVQRNEDVRSMANEFRCYAQHRIAMFEEQQRKSIFKLSKWIADRLSLVFSKPADAVGADLKASLEECDFTKPAKRKSRFL